MNATRSSRPTRPSRSSGDGDTVCGLGLRRHRHAGRAAASRSSERFRETRRSRADLTLVFAAAPGDGKERGLNRLADERLVRRVRRRALGARAEARRSSPSTTRSRPTTCRSAASRISTATSRHGGRDCCRTSGLRTFVDPRLRRRQAQRPHHRRPRRAASSSTARTGCSTRPSRSRSRSSAARRPTPPATSPWSGRR